MATADGNGTNGAEAGGGPDPVIIKKYANRRLYNTETSAYITLEHLAALTREGREFVVLDAKTGEDITHSVLTQIIMEAEGRGATMLPSNFLRQLIGLYGGTTAGMVPHYLEASMDAFAKSNAQVRDAMTGAFAGSPLAEIAKRNIEMFEKAAGAFVPKAADKPARPAAPDDEVASLKAQLAELQAKVDKLSP
jgi:polyhydroxyalkanoate synthesis repressor PhaR